MARRLQSKTQRANVYKLNVCFNIKSLNMSALTGRTAHLMFIGDHILMRMLFSQYGFLCA